ncbi:tetratricopeptide repeat protein [Uliginosibacterium sp. H3]|uniref:Tetratricopeptide repeat protein n=1 Tax=Uliginosibacterium silvisoli TaxID=3114758 RepID=A0ABU6JXY6_9RHOO|nr:tetratricopeptide repeat protein [Uliginosibacterium sp. H3]
MRDPNHAAYLKGNKLFKQGRFVDAGAQFQLAIEEWPQDWQAMWALGNCFTELKKPRKAEEQFKAALQLAAVEELPNLLFNLGNALFDQGKYDAAIAEYRRVPKGHHIARSAANNIALAEKRMTGEP